jgi:hypothetical protein
LCRIGRAVEEDVELDADARSDAAYQPAPAPADARSWRLDDEHEAVGNLPALGVVTRPGR